MNKYFKKEFPSKVFETKITEIIDKTKNLGELALNLNKKTLTLLESYDQKIYEDIVKGSSQIDIESLELERKCINFIASEQPVAKDLLYIESTIRVISHIKRIGRLTFNIGDAIKGLRSTDIPKNIKKELISMGNCVQLMLKKSINVFLNQDIEKAKELSNDDDKVDELCDSIFSQIPIEIAKNNKLIPNIIDIILLTRSYERIADKTVNIGSRTIFILTLERPDIHSNELINKDK